MKVLLESGKLVPDKVTIALVKERLQESDCQGGAVLDGFPRTPAQAAALDYMLEQQGFCVNVAPYISVEDEVVVERLSGRRTDLRTGKTYHITFEPPPEDAEAQRRGGGRDTRGYRVFGISRVGTAGGGGRALVGG